MEKSYRHEKHDGKIFEISLLRNDENIINENFEFFDPDAVSTEEVVGQSEEEGDVETEDQSIPDLDGNDPYEETDQQLGNCRNRQDE